jgi:hypothetical protein
MSKTLVLTLAAVVGVLGAYTLVNTTNNALYASADTQWQRDGSKGHAGRMHKGLEDKAEILGVTVEELRSAREEGKTMQDIMGEAGISAEEFHSRMEENMRNRMQERGLSEEEINERLETRKEHRENCDGIPHKGGF